MKSDAKGAGCVIPFTHILEQDSSALLGTGPVRAVELSVKGPEMRSMEVFCTLIEVLVTG